MPDRPFNIVSLDEVPTSALAALHLRYLSSPYAGYPGSKLQELYYQVVRKADDTLGFAAVADDLVAGFACAMRRPATIRHAMVRTHPLRLLFWYTLQACVRPRALVYAWHRFRPRRTSASRPRWQRPVDWQDWYTYGPLVVHEAYRKHRLADVLTQHTLDAVAQRGVPGVISFVKGWNPQSRVTHIRNGFREVWKSQDTLVYARELAMASSPGPKPRMDVETS